MDHYIAYHSVDLMGHEYPDADPEGLFSYYSRKPEPALRKMLGSAVWVIVGKRSGTRTRYRVAGVYSPSDLDQNDDAWLVQGRGVHAPSATDVTDLPWFHDLLREQSNFSFGLNRVRDAAIVASLKALIPNGASIWKSEIPSSGKPGTPSFIQSDVFPIVARLISTAAQTQPQRFVTHDEIVDMLLHDEAGRHVVIQARSASAWDNDQSAASNMVAWFSQQITVGNSEWAELFERSRIGGAWAYRPSSKSPTARFTSPYPDEVPDEAVLTEGAAKTVQVNAYERSPEARRKCIEHYGSRCAVCSMNFAEVYGAIAEGFIHVHHFKPLAEIGTSYVVDPVADLRPVCPNCHAILHRRSPPLEIDELRALMANELRIPTDGA